MIEIPKAERLAPYDRQSDLWQRLNALLTRRLQQFRVMNDQRMTDEARQYLIGHIEEIKCLLQLGEDPPPTIKIE